MAGLFVVCGGMTWPLNDDVQVVGYGSPKKAIGSLMVCLLCMEDVWC